MPRAQLIQIRQDIDSNWSTRNPVLAVGEPGYDKTTGVVKVGDGVTPWNSLPAVGDAGTQVKAAMDSLLSRPQVFSQDVAPTNPRINDVWIH